MCDKYDHEYDENICTKCGQDFCWACCGNTNVHEGGKHEPDFMLCPKCGHDYFGDDDPEAIAEGFVNISNKNQADVRKAVAGSLGIKA